MSWISTPSIVSPDPCPFSYISELIASGTGGIGSSPVLTSTIYPLTLLLVVSFSLNVKFLFTLTNNKKPTVLRANERPRRKQRGITHVIDFINAASGWEYTPK